MESETSLLHYGTPEYFMFSSTNVSEEKKPNCPLFQDYLEVYGCEKASKLTFIFIPYSPSADGNHVGYLN